MNRRVLALGALLSIVAPVVATATDPIRLRLAGGDWSPSTPPPPIYRTVEVAPPGASPLGRRYLVVVADRPLDAADRRRLEAAGGELLDYFPERGYRLRVAPGREGIVRALPFVRWVGDLPPAARISPPLLARLARPEGGAVDLRVVLFRDEPPARALALLGPDAAAAPSGKDEAWRLSGRVAAGELRSVLARLVALAEVESVEEVRPFRLANQDAVWVHQSFVGPTPQQAPIFAAGLVGCGEIVGVADSGQDYSSCFFRDTVNGPPPFSTCTTVPCPAGTPAMNRRKDVIYYNWSGTPNGDDDTCPATTGGSGHGTHTSGSIAGDNATYANCTSFTAGRSGGDGQAPGAKLVVQEMGDGLEYLNNLGGTVWNLASVAYQNGARIHSNSWGGACFDMFGNCVPGCSMPYDSFARDADLAMWSYPDLLLLFSAGNAGLYCPAPVSVGTPGIAKSPLTVGSVGHGTNASTPSGFSSPGPVFDGRLKPTVAAEGETVVSARSDGNGATANCDTCSLDGTSMAAPVTAGLAALVREYYRAGYLAAGARNPALGFVPSGALVKATLVDGAVALGTSAPAPDFESGYGRVLLNATLPFAGSPFQLRVDDHREGITTGSVVVHAYDVAAGSPFRATLVWSDYPAALGAATARVNELKLEVVDPAGTVWFQTIDAGTGAPKATSNPGDPHDELNVEERLVFPTPAAGRWIVRVRGVDVPWGPQPFALVVRGALADCPATIAPTAPTVTVPAPNQLQVSWSAVPGASRYNVYRSFGSCPSAPWVPVATGLATTGHLDTTVSGGVTYAYVVVATSDADAACESPRSPCASATATGDCFLAPTFAGAGTATSAGTSACAIDLSWNAASPRCGADVRYNVYRSTTPGFTPGPSNRIARCLVPTTFRDEVGLVSGTTYEYVVRSEDATTGHGGPCRGGNEDANVARASATAGGPPVLGSWSDDAGDTGAAKMTTGAPWSVMTTGGAAGPRVYRVASAAGLCADLVTPVLTLGDPGESPALSFATRHTLEYDAGGPLGAEGSVGVVEIATGPDFSTWTRIPLSPNYPATVEFLFNNCPTTAAAGSYFSGTASVFATYTASLLNWGGGEAAIRFHVSGDQLYPGGAWWVDDIVVSGVLVPSTCSTSMAGPPPVPDGWAVPGTPLTAAKNGGAVRVSWDSSRCPATAVNVYRGALGSWGSFTGGSCALPAAGPADLALPADSWFLAAATDGAGTDGSYGLDESGAERLYAGAAAACPGTTAHVTTNGCP